MIYFITMGLSDTINRYYPGFPFLDDSEKEFFVRKYPIKIGYSTNPVQRLEQLQTGNPFWLYLHAVIEGDMDVEAAWHNKFAKSRVAGEWFTAMDWQLELAIHKAVDCQVRMQLITNPGKTRAVGYLNQLKLDEIKATLTEENQDD